MLPILSTFWQYTHWLIDVNHVRIQCWWSCCLQQGVSIMSSLDESLQQKQMSRDPSICDSFAVTGRSLEHVLIINFNSSMMSWVTAKLQTIPLHKWWGFSTTQSGSHIHVIHMQDIWQPSYAMNGHMDPSLLHFHHQIWQISRNPGSLLVYSSTITHMMRIYNHPKWIPHPCHMYTRCLTISIYNCWAYGFIITLLLMQVHEMDVWSGLKWISASTMTLCQVNLNPQIWWQLGRCNGIRVQLYSLETAYQWLKHFVYV